MHLTVVFQLELANHRSDLELELELELELDKNRTN